MSIMKNSLWWNYGSISCFSFEIFKEIIITFLSCGNFQSFWKILNWHSINFCEVCETNRIIVTTVIQTQITGFSMQLLPNPNCNGSIQFSLFSVDSIERSITFERPMDDILDVALFKRNRLTLDISQYYSHEYIMFLQEEVLA